MSVLHVVKKRKPKSRVLGQVKVVRREDFDDLDLNAKIEFIRNMAQVGMLHVQEMLDENLLALAGPRHARGDEWAGSRHGSNPGSVFLAGQRLPVKVPRVRGPEGEITLEAYQALHERGTQADEVLLKRVLYGISCRNYEAAAEAIPGAIGLSSSTVSRQFVAASAAQLRSFQERDLSGEDIVALFLDGKAFADDMMVVALGIRITGEKVFLGFVQTDTENEKVLTPFLRSLLSRGLDISKGLLVVLDGSKGLRSSVKKAFRGRAVVQRCMWHKRENIVSYLAKSEQVFWRRRLQLALDRPTEAEARRQLMSLHKELEEKNQSAAASLMEGLEEILTLHRLGVYGVLGRSFKTTNCIESVNARVEERCLKIDSWKNSSQKERWLVTALLDIEPRMHRVMGHRHLSKLRAAIMCELKVEAVERSSEMVA
jgi:transposase-like protein